MFREQSQPYFTTSQSHNVCYTQLALIGLGQRGLRKGRHKAYPYKKEINSKVPKMLNGEDTPKSVSFRVLRDNPRFRREKENNSKGPKMLNREGPKNPRHSAYSA